MFPLFTGLGPKAPVEGFLIFDLFELGLVLFKLPLEAEIGADGGPAGTEKGNGFFEAPVIFLHEVGDDEG